MSYARLQRARGVPSGAGVRGAGRPLSLAHPRKPSVRPPYQEAPTRTPGALAFTPAAPTRIPGAPAFTPRAAAFTLGSLAFTPQGTSRTPSTVTLGTNTITKKEPLVVGMPTSGAVRPQSGACTDDPPYHAAATFRVSPPQAGGLHTARKRHWRRHCQRRCTAISWPSRAIYFAHQFFQVLRALLSHFHRIAWERERQRQASAVVDLRVIGAEAEGLEPPVSLMVSANATTN